MRPTTSRWAIVAVALFGMMIAGSTGCRSGRSSWPGMAWWKGDSNSTSLASKPGPKYPSPPSSAFTPDSKPSAGTAPAGSSYPSYLSKGGPAGPASNGYPSTSNPSAGYDNIGASYDSGAGYKGSLAGGAGAQNGYYPQNPPPVDCPNCRAGNCSQHGNSNSSYDSGVRSADRRNQSPYNQPPYNDNGGGFSSPPAQNDYQYDNGRDFKGGAYDGGPDYKAGPYGAPAGPSPGNNSYDSGAYGGPSAYQGSSNDSRPTDRGLDRGDSRDAYAARNEDSLRNDKSSGLSDNSLASRELPDVLSRRRGDYSPGSIGSNHAGELISKRDSTTSDVLNGGVQKATFQQTPRDERFPGNQPPAGAAFRNDY